MFETNRESKKPIIFIDVDDTIADTRSAIASLYEEITGDKVLDIRTIKSKRYCNFCPLWNDEDVEKLFKSHSGVYSRVRPLPGAIEAVKVLISRGFDVRLVTMHSPQSIMLKHNWIEKYFPELANTVYYVDWHLGNKDVFSDYAIVDDDIKNIKTNSSQKAILLDFYDIYDENYFSGTKCKNWNEVLKIIFDNK